MEIAIKEEFTKDFSTFEVSTKTFIVFTNLNLNLEEIFEGDAFPIAKYIVVKKKRGRKKKIQEEDPNKDIKNGSIIQIKFKSNYKGVLIKSKKGKGFFRNSMTFVMIIDGKVINFKVSRNGKFQMTGCKTDEQAEKCVGYFWKYLEKNTNLYSLKKENNPLEKEPDHLIAYYNPVMYNIDFSLGFQIIRENLDRYINIRTPYTSLLETTAGYTGVNIKMPVKADYSKLLIKRIDYVNNDKKEISFISYDNFLKNFDHKKARKVMYNTFLVFQSGKIIMSGKTSIFMERSYYEFIEIIKSCSEIIREEFY